MVFHVELCLFYGLKFRSSLIGSIESDVSRVGQFSSEMFVYCGIDSTDKSLL